MYQTRKIYDTDGHDENTDRDKSGAEDEVPPWFHACFAGMDCSKDTFFD
jgi:hypothetical protein